MGLYSKLDAVGTLLAAVGDSPLALLDETDETTMVLINQLEKTSREVQAMGWSFNYEEGVSLAPNSDGQIVVPDSVLQISMGFNDLMIVQRGNKLYSKKLHSYTINASVIVDITYLLAWEDLPAHAQLAIMRKSAAEYSLNNIGSDFQLKSLQQLASEAWVAFQTIEGKNDPVLFLDPRHNGEVANMLYRGPRSGVFPNGIQSNLLHRG